MSHEQMQASYIIHPDSSSSLYDDGSPVDAGTAMIMASNEGRLCDQSYRQLVLSPDAIGYNLAGKADSWEGLTDASGPSTTDVAGADAVYKTISWCPAYALCYGPFFVPCDRTDDNGRLVCRRIKGRVKWTSTAASARTIIVILTRHNSALRVADGLVDAYTSVAISSATSSTLSVDFTPSFVDRPVEDFACRAGGSGSVGATIIGLTPVFLWVGVKPSADLLTINSVSFWEAP